MAWPEAELGTQGKGKAVRNVTLPHGFTGATHLRHIHKSYSSNTPYWLGRFSLILLLSGNTSEERCTWGIE